MKIKPTLNDLLFLDEQYKREEYKINSIIILFLDNQFKNKEYVLYRSMGCLEYIMGNDSYFTYDPDKNIFETSTYLDRIIKKYIPEYRAFNEKTMTLVSDWCQKNLSR